ncbi:MAG TPA: ParB N-terminal domain-containing protein [Chloroflexota bacterium]|nr:ParB N-terminal domain-containing protein [Chloroflexota bacterium]
MDARFLLLPWRRQGRGPVARFPFGQEGDPMLTMLPPHVEPIPVDSVVGSVDRYRQLDGRFRPGRRMTQRLRGIIGAMKNGAQFPPIEVYRLEGACYVIDGHHRVAAALDVGQLYLDAMVIECRSPAEVGNPLEAARIDFGLRTGLRTIAFSTPARYAQALQQIHEHRWYLNERGKRVSLREASEDWRQHIFVPVARQLATEGLVRPEATTEAGDLYLKVSDLKYGVSRERGHDIGFSLAVREWAANQYQPDSSAFFSHLLEMSMMALG